MGIASRSAVFVLMALGSVPGEAVSAEGQIELRHVVVDFSDINEAQARRFAAMAEAGFVAVTSFLGRTVDAKIRIGVAEGYRFPHFDPLRDSVVIPANRLRGDSGGPSRMRGRGTAIVSILTRRIAPSAHPKWGSFLSIGLGLYMQEQFGPKSDPSFPAMGRDLHAATVELATDYGKFIPLAETERMRSISIGLSRTRILAYLQEGSFVRHLIETRGLERFMKFHGGIEAHRAFGVTFEMLEAEWKNRLDAVGRRAAD